MNSRDIRLLGLVAFASMVSMRMCDPMLLQWAMDFNVSQGQASHVIAAFSIAYGVMQLIYGPLGQRLGIMRLITWAAGISTILSVLTALSSGLDALLIARSAMGGVAAAIIPLSMAWIGDQVAYDSRQQTLARLMSATVTGVMAGQWFGGFAAQYLGWRWAFGDTYASRGFMYPFWTRVALDTKQIIFIGQAFAASSFTPVAELQTLCTQINDKVTQQNFSVREGSNGAVLFARHSFSYANGLPVRMLLRGAKQFASSFEAAINMDTNQLLVKKLS